MAPYIKAEFEFVANPTTNPKSFSAVPTAVKARIVRHVALQDEAYNQRADPGAEERFWASEEKDLPAVDFVVRGGEGEQDIPLAPAAVDEFMEESEEEEGGEGGDSEESENEGVMIVDEADEGGDSEDESQEEFRDEDGLEVHGVLAAQAVPEKNKKTSWKGRGISALFLVCKELNNLVAVHLFKVVYSRRFINASYWTSFYRRHSVHCRTLNLRGRGAADRSVKGFLIVFSLLHSFPNLTNLVFDKRFPDFLYEQPLGSLGIFTGQIDWLKTKLTELGPRINSITAYNLDLANLPPKFGDFPRVESVKFVDEAKYVNPIHSTKSIDIVPIIEAISPGAQSNLRRLEFQSDNIYHLLPLDNRLDANSVKNLRHFGWNTRSLSKEVVKFIKCLGPSVQSASVSEVSWPAEEIPDHQLEAILPSLRSLTLSGDGATLSNSLFLFKDATLTDFSLSSTTGISYLLSSGFLLSFLKKQAPTLKTLRLSALDHYSIHADMKPVLDLVKRHNIILTASDSNYFSHWPTTAVSRPHHDQTIPLTPAEKEMRSKIMHRKIDEQLRMRKVELERLVREKDLVGLQAFAGLIGKGLKDRMLAMRD